MCGRPPPAVTTQLHSLVATTHAVGVCGGGLAVSRGGRIDTQLFNGYADQVSYLYDGVEGEALYM